MGSSGCIHLSDVCELIVDCPHSTAKDEGEGYPLIRTPNIGPGYLDLSSVHRVSRSVYEKRNARATPQPGDIILAREAPAGNAGIIPKGQEVCLGQRTVLIRPIRQVADPLFINYYLNAPQQRQHLLNSANGATVSHVNMSSIRSLPVQLPDIEKQRKTARILDAFDSLIRCNERINDYLLDLATAQFEAALQTECREVRFGDIIELEDSKRIPLNSRDREQRKGPYPYYGATSVMDYVDDYLFDGIRILLGEDGSVITDDGYPVLQYVWGKYWVNNHAHILKPCGEYPMEMLYVALSRTAIPHIVTGAVQKKISQKNLSSLILEMPNPEDVKGLEDLFTLHRNNVDENKELEQLRDCLLPKLMSGKIDVSEVELPTLPNNHLSAD